MTRSALPDHLNDPDEIEAAFPDDSKNGPVVRWLKKKTKHWFAFSYRATEWWARWRRFPVTLFAIGGNGPWRIESDHDEFHLPAKTFFMASGRHAYLSRVQYWKRWHLAVQWPLQITFHCYWNAADVCAPRHRPEGMSIRKMFNIYFPSHRDSDAVIWFPSIGIGGTFK